jgi:3',5'-cyclic AMP phosphodiesterase CpdA
MIRLAHFSDIHITSPKYEWRLQDWFSKRLISWANHRFARGPHFARAEEIVARLMDELPARGVEHLVFSGDATALGFESEIRQAATALRVGANPIPGLAVPGNHDYCTLAAAQSGHFERHFAPWLQGRRIGEHAYPFAQQAGPVWLIGVNAATGNRWPWDAAGAVGPAQLERLRQLLAELPTGVKILVTHFPICLSSGRREKWYHGLRDLDAVLDVAHAGGIHLWLHGHRHAPYYFQTPDRAAFPVICAGTATQRHLWSYGEYTIDGAALTALRRVYDPDARSFRDIETFSLKLPIAT